MKKLWKYGVLPLVIFVFLLVVTVLLMPALINVQQYVPQIEKSISKALGRPFSIGSDVAISFFPSPSLSFSGMKLGNPAGFKSDALVKIDYFEARVKLLPLFKKEIQVSRFVVGGLEINLEKNREGKVNWDFVIPKAVPRLDLLEDSISCKLLAVTDGRVNWIDRTNNARHTVDDLMLLLHDVQVNHPIGLDFRASYDGRPVALEGEIGPLRQKEGNRSLPLDIGFRLLEKLPGQIKGKVENWQSSAPVYDIALQLSSFSPRALFAALDLPFPVETSDPATFQAFELEMTVKGGGETVTVEKGAALLDDTRLLLVGELKKMKEVNFILDIDRLDLDRYLPPRDRREMPPDAAGEEAASGAIYRFAGSIPASLVGVVKLETLKLLGGTVSGVEAYLGGREGVFTLDKASMELYGGQLQANMAADLSAEAPRVRVAVESQGIDTATMLREMGGPDLLSGTLSGNLVVEFFGDVVEAVQESLSGEASFALVGGALPGIDLHRSIHSRELVKEGRTDFAELRGGVSIERGFLTIREAVLQTADMAMVIGGGADIPARAWNLQIAPQGVEAKPAKGKRPLPLAIAGTFAPPEFNFDDSRQPNRGREGADLALAGLVDEKLPSPIDEEVKGLVGKPLIDPAIVAQRFHLQRETIRRSEMKKRLQLGSGKIRINPLLVRSQKPETRNQKYSR